MLELVAHEDRILVTFDAKDFAPLLPEWAEARRSHAGCILVQGLDHSEFGRLLRELDRLLADQPAQDRWTDVVLFLPAAQVR